ncbi:hypothetical protein F5X97DRAFT_250119 [Nemania serpens]|nr:hypothetical protein F5X97DRAFT_250119 [Nemania serpens]
MRLTTALYFLAFSSCSIAAPIATALDSVPSQADLSNSGTRQELRIGPIKSPTQQPNKTRGRKGSKQPLRSSGVSTSPLSRRPPRKSNPHYIASLAHRLTNKSPFSESSIVREETRASTGDWEPEATIVEWETKASREAHFWIPCFSAGKIIRYHCLRVNTDMLVVSLVLSLIAIIIVIELWKPVISSFRSFRSSHGPIYLNGNEETNKERVVRFPCISCGLMPEASLENKGKHNEVDIATAR